MVPGAAFRGSVEPQSLRTFSTALTPSTAKATTGPEVMNEIRNAASSDGTVSGRITRRKVSPAPKVLTELGELVSVVYRTRKRGESSEYFEHEFEDRRPRLGMDIKNRRLHVLGGAYTVTADGITG